MRTVIVSNERVIADPQVGGGAPIVKGTRIPVELVLEHLAQDPDLGELFADYPQLTVEDAKAVLDYGPRQVCRRDPR